MRKILFTIFLIAIVLSGCGGADVGDDTVNSEVSAKGRPASGWNNDDGDESNELQVFILDIDGELFDVEMPEQEEYTPLDSEHLTGYTAYDVLKSHVEKQGIELKIKEYGFGVFIEQIGDKIGDKNNFWLYYVNGKPANASADRVKVELGDVIKFEWTSNNPF